MWSLQPWLLWDHRHCIEWLFCLGLVWSYYKWKMSPQLQVCLPWCCYCSVICGHVRQMRNDKTVENASHRESKSQTLRPRCVAISDTHRGNLRRTKHRYQLPARLLCQHKIIYCLAFPILTQIFSHWHNGVTGRHTGRHHSLFHCIFIVGDFQNVIRTCDMMLWSYSDSQTDGLERSVHFPICQWGLLWTHYNYQTKWIFQIYSK